MTSLYLKRCGLLPLHCAYSKRIQSKQYTQNWPDDDATDLNNKAREMAKITAYVRVHVQLIIHSGENPRKMKFTNFDRFTRP